MRVKRSIFGILVLMLAAIFAAGSAQASVPTDHEAGGHVLTLPPAPRGAQSTSLQATTAVAPEVSPSTYVTYALSGDSIVCYSGELCPAVWDPTVSEWKTFHLEACHTYYLSHWYDWGYYKDFQTGGVTSYFYGQTGNTLRRFTPDSYLHTVDWGPVWSIRNC